MSGLTQRWARGASLGAKHSPRVLVTRLPTPQCSSLSSLCGHSFFQEFSVTLPLFLHNRILLYRVGLNSLCDQAGLSLQQSSYLSFLTGRTIGVSKCLHSHGQHFTSLGEHQEDVFCTQKRWKGRQIEAVYFLCCFIQLIFWENKRTQGDGTGQGCRNSQALSGCLHFAESCFHFLLFCDPLRSHLGPEEYWASILQISESWEHCEHLGSFH